MYIQRQVSFTDDNRTITLNVPTPKNAQAFIDAVRPIYVRGAKAQLDKNNVEMLDMFLPDMDLVNKVVDAIIPFVTAFVDKENQQIDLENLSISDSVFIYQTAITLYSDIFQTSEIKKK